MSRSSIEPAVADFCRDAAVCSLRYILIRMFLDRRP